MRLTASTPGKGSLCFSLIPLPPFSPSHPLTSGNTPQLRDLVTEHRNYSSAYPPPPKAHLLSLFDLPQYSFSLLPMPGHISDLRFITPGKESLDLSFRMTLGTQSTKMAKVSSERPEKLKGFYSEHPYTI